MAEFRYNGLNAQQKRIIGYIEAKNMREARRKIDALAKQHSFSLLSIQQKAAYLYKVRRLDGAVLKGDQIAFSREEVEVALRRLGFEDVRVQKVIFDLRLKPPYADIITFIRLSADLLREKLPFDEILGLLESDTQNKALRKVIKEILTDLKDGKDGEEAFSKQAYYLGKFPAKMLGVASKSGNMAEVFDNTARFLERDYEFRKSLRSALLMPAITTVVLIGSVIFYVGYIFPKTAELFLSFGATLPPLTKASLDLSHFLTRNISWIIGMSAIIPLVLYRLAITPRGRIFVAKHMTKVPIIGTLMHKTSIEIFCRVFHSMYSGSGENLEVIRTAAEACRNKYMEKQIKEVTIPMMVRDGATLVQALKQARVFTENALSRLNAGAESGTLKRVTLQIANYYERETTYRMKAIIDWVQVIVAMLIMAVMTALTIVSSETALFQPKMPGM
ncbi:MAG TPA: type II secretion system F family protein [bacterium]|nr:type II secretion system F family protein [bacterium]HQG44783.1 type II secretion system F family protein [bacterium]HQI49182.1 type II secretion system F family protein [bacterium]HQJ64849.1 type II secretion system F family protein [bacterium]